MNQSDHLWNQVLEILSKKTIKKTHQFSKVEQLYC